METLRVQYRLHVAAERAAARAEELAREQTVEVPRAVVRDAFVEQSVLGRVREVATDPAGGQRVSIDYPLAATALDPAQILNVLFGNASLQHDVECLDAEFPASLVAALGGPRFGSAGLRKAVGVYDRPLTCTAVKPMGLGPEALADLLRCFARAGIDVVKDDHGLADHAFCPFEQRVRACLAAAEEVADETGRRVLYVPNLIGAPSAVFRNLDTAQKLGARAVMASPMLIGLPVFWELCRQRASLPVIAHPAFAGAARMAPDLLMGRIFRLYGADAVIFVSFGSRFRVTQQSCRRLVQNLSEPLGDALPSLPVAGGGILLDTVPDRVRFYGRDCMLLVGGDLQLDAADTGRRARAFAEAVRAAAAGGCA